MLAEIVYWVVGTDPACKNKNHKHYAKHMYDLVHSRNGIRSTELLT